MDGHSLTEPNNVSDQPTQVESLPTEILSRIFVYSLSEDDHDRMQASYAPLLLCQVSSQWRNVAIAMPLL